MPLSDLQRKHLREITDALRLLNAHAQMVSVPCVYKDFSATNLTARLSRCLVRFLFYFYTAGISYKIHSLVLRFSGAIPPTTLNYCPCL